MKIAIFGAGAIGGYLGARLAQAGQEVTLVARGEHLRAMQNNGLRLKEAAGEFTVRPRCVEDAGEAGPQDYVIVALKAHQFVTSLDAVLPLIGPETPLVTAQNGLPWWYFYKQGGEFEDRTIEAVDPRGRIWRAVGPDRVIGCVVYPACEIEQPGLIRHIAGNRFSLGEPDGSRTQRMDLLAKALIAAGLRAPVRTDLRSEIWLKLWGNAVLNPISVLSGASLSQILGYAPSRAVAKRAMIEVAGVAQALGQTGSVDVDSRLDGAAEVGEHKTSMLQDHEAGRELELDALSGAVLELAHWTGTAVPNLEALDALTRLAAKAH